MRVNCKVDVKGALKQLANVKDKQIPFATSLAINRTALKVKSMQEREINDVFDKPTKFIQNSIFYKRSDKHNLTATVGIKDTRLGGGVPPVKPLIAEISGGSRKLKNYEIALRSAGVLPNGYFTVPGEAAKMDMHGNMKRSQLNEIITYVKSFRVSKSRAQIEKSTSKKYGVSYFVGAPGDGKSPLGIWQRIYSNFGTATRPIMIFVKSANYEPTYDFKFVAESTVYKEFNREFIRAWEEAERTAK